MRSVLITGGTGYFAKGFVRRLLTMDVTRICIFSRNEFSQAQMRRAMDDERLRWFIGDVRDADRLRRAMNGVDVVVHAAALKRIEVAEYNVLESVATNVIGTANVVSAAIDAKVQKAVLLSTDKAVEPTNAYGLSKALAEKIFLSAEHYAGAHGTRFAVTRYGNVAGSTGSVIPTWRALLNGTRVVPVTDPEATRFWMTLEEAVDLVLATIETMAGGEVSVPSLPAYRLGDLAEAMDAQMHVTGLLPGEKKHESMIPGVTSEQARRLSVEEIRQRLQEVQ